MFSLIPPRTAEVRFRHFNINSDHIADAQLELCPCYQKAQLHNMLLLMLRHSPLVPSRSPPLFLTATCFFFRVSMYTQWPLNNDFLCEVTAFHFSYSITVVMFPPVFLYVEQ